MRYWHVDRKKKKKKEKKKKKKKKKKKNAMQYKTLPRWGGQGKKKELEPCVVETTRTLPAFGVSQVTQGWSLTPQHM